MKNSLFHWEEGSESENSDLVKQVHELTLSLDQKITLISKQLSALHLATGNTEAPLASQYFESKSATATPGLPSPRLLRRIIKNRSYRREYFPQGLFADPAWDMLLDLAAAQAEYRQVSITSLCLASGVPNTTALRYVDMLIESNLCAKRADTKDRRRTWIELTERGSKAVADYFSRIVPVSK
jgi:predicted transcriptional regulator